MIPAARPGGVGHNGAMALLRSGVDAHTKAELTQLLGHPPRPLASGRSPEGPVVGLLDRLVYRTVDGWSQLAWHEVERGGWDAETGRLRWTNTAGEAVELDLPKPGRLPQLFNERVTATIICTEILPLAGSHSAVISARRNLAQPDAPLIWKVSPGIDTTAEQVVDDQLVAVELERLRSEFDRG